MQTKRNIEIFKRVLNGETTISVSKQYKISPVRVRQIIQHKRRELVRNKAFKSIRHLRSDLKTMRDNKNIYFEKLYSLEVLDFFQTCKGVGGVKSSE